MELLTRDKCFQAGWQLLEPNTWEYRDIFTGNRGIATVENLQSALKAKTERLLIKEAIVHTKRKK